MEVSGLNPGLRLLRCIWILLPRMVLAASCPDAADVVIPCPLNELDGVNCTYVKGIPNQLPELPFGGIEFPGPVEELTAQPFLKYEYGSCNTYLNITWQINVFARQNLQGFILNVTFLYAGVQRYIYRTYSLSVANWTNMNIYETAFRHECIQPVFNESSEYRIEVHSLPLSTIVNKRNVAITKYMQTANVTTMQSCDNPDDPYMTYNWVATMWTSSSDENLNSLEICFFFAPAVFNFNKYRMVLMNFTTSVFQETLNETFVYDNGSQVNRQSCVKFDNICAGIYQVQLMPIAETGSCLCRSGPSEPNDCVDTCTSTVLKPIDKSNSVCSPRTTPKKPSDVPTLPRPPDAAITTGGTENDETSRKNPSEGLSDGKIAGIVIGVTLAFMTIAAIIFVLCILKRRKFKKMECYSETSNVDSQISTTLSERCPVLLVYSTDNESHRKAIQSLAVFLNACCGCDVQYDEWSQISIAQTNPIDWLMQQMHSVKRIVIVNSLGAYEQHRGWIGQKQYVSESNLLLPDVFMPAIRQIQNKVFMGSHQLLCFHVSFPYTDQKHVLDLGFGKCYRLMDHIEDLFLNIHGLTKLSARGTTSANQITATNYLKMKEGRALYNAIEEAGHYARENPDWFQNYYRHDDGASTNENAELQPRDQLLELRSVSWCPGSDGAIEESGTGSIGTASDMEYFPPSLDGSHNGIEAEMTSVAPDDGIGGMNYHQTAFEAASSSSSSSSSPQEYVQFTPLPPDDLDDGSSIGSRSFVAKMHELNEQYDSGFPSSSQDLDRINRSNC